MEKFMPGWFVAIFSLMIVCISVGAAKADDGPVAIQLNPVAITAISENGYTGRAVVTPYFSVINAKALERLCGRLPRLSEVVLIAFDETPAELVRLEAHIQERQAEFKARVEEVIGVGVFNGFYVTAGAYKRGEGTELLDVAGGTSACQPIKQFPWEVGGEPKVSLFKPDLELQTESSATRPSSLSEQELAAAEAELLAEQPPRGAFPGEPKLPSSKTPSWVIYGVFVFGLGGVMLIAGSYIGYQVAKIRRERRRLDRRKLRKERRSQIDRRQQQLALPEGGDRRKDAERRKVSDRRKDDRREKRDRRDKD